MERGVQDVAGEGEIVPSVLGFAFTKRLRASHIHSFYLGKSLLKVSMKLSFFFFFLSFLTLKCTFIR